MGVGNLYASSCRLLFHMGRPGVAGPGAGQLNQYHADEFAGFGLYQCRFYRRAGDRVIIGFGLILAALFVYKPATYLEYNPLYRNGGSGLPAPAVSYPSFYATHLRPGKGRRP